MNATAASPPRSFVLVHGAWHGGWCWDRVAALLRASGHRVVAPTLTGLAERAHLLSRDITLDTFTDDVAKAILEADLREVVLVGHSFGGLPISGVADRMPERLRRLVYLDAIILQDGQSPFGVLPPALVAERRRLIAEQGGGIGLPPPGLAALGIPEGHPETAAVAARLTPHPAGTYESALRLAHPVGNGLPCTYIACTDPLYAPLEGARRWVRGRPGWTWREIATGHDAMVTAPEALAALLAEIG